VSLRADCSGWSLITTAPAVVINFSWEFVNILAFASILKRAAPAANSGPDDFRVAVSRGIDNINDGATSGLFCVLQ